MEKDMEERVASAHFFLDKTRNCSCALRCSWGLQKAWSWPTLGARATEGAKEMPWAWRGSQNSTTVFLLNLPFEGIWRLVRPGVSQSLLR